MTTTTATKPTTTATVKAIPEGYHSITSVLVCKDAAKSIEFYKKALGATEVMSMPCMESGKIMHAELKVGDSIFFVSDEAPQMGCMSSPVALWLYVQDCDASFKRAVDAGATVKMPSWTCSGAIAWARSPTCPATRSRSRRTSWTSRRTR